MTMRAFIDEAGDRGLRRGASSNHFVMSAVLWRAQDDALMDDRLNTLKASVNRQTDQRLHFTKLNHYQRLQAAATLGSLGLHHEVEGPLRCITIAIRKFDASDVSPGWNQDMAYLGTYRLLLERMTWLAREHHETLDITVSHIKRFEKKKLRSYEDHLRVLDTKIAWEAAPKGARMVAAADDPRLDWADIAASSAFHALEKDPRNGGFSEWRYLKKVSPALWRRQDAQGELNLLSYGFKLAPGTVRDTPYAWCEDM